MLKIKVRNMQNAEISGIDFPEEIFDYPLKEHLIYEAVKNFQANKRRGTASTKTRSKVSGSGKKLWRQKGTGRARVGSIRSPLRRKGGIVFGPQPRDYSYSMPKKARRNALKSIISDKVRNKKIYIIDKLDVKSNKTRDMMNILKKFNFDKMLIVDKKENSDLMLSTRNIPNIKAVDFNEVNVYDSLKYNYIMFSVDAIKQLAEVLK